MQVKQKTLSSPVTFEGVGIHSGASVIMTVAPAEENTGLYFIRTDLSGARVTVSINNLKHTDRATSLEENNIRISTPEHILSALAAHGITNARITLNNEEAPIMDGSSLPFYEAIEATGTTEQDASLSPITLKSPIRLEYETKSIIAIPQDTPSFTYFFEYPNTHVPAQMAHLGDMATYKAEIAPARTFGFEHEINYLKSQGLAQGGTLENALVIGKEDYINPTRFENECARHKCLDLIGDCWVAERPILASIVGIKTGHADTMNLLKEIMNQNPDA